MRNIILTISLIIIISITAGCDLAPNADSKQSEQTEILLADANRQIGMPGIVNFQQRKLLKMILEECDKEKLIAYAYIKSDYQGKLVFLGKCIGYGVPFSAQFTNPEKIIKFGGNTRYAGSQPSTIPQADPNGLFMPTSSSATWLLMIDPNTGKPRPVYLEPEIIVSPFPFPESIVLK